MDIAQTDTQTLNARLKVLEDEATQIRRELLNRDNTQIDLIEAEAIRLYSVGPNGKAESMRFYRQHTGCSLREAHDAVNRLVGA